MIGARGAKQFDFWWQSRATFIYAFIFLLPIDGFTLNFRK